MRNPGLVFEICWRRNFCANFYLSKRKAALTLCGAKLVRRFFFSGASGFSRGKFHISVQHASKFMSLSYKVRSWQEEPIHYQDACPFLKDAGSIARRRTCLGFAQKSITFFQRSMLEPCNTLTGNLSAHVIYTSNWFLTCAFRLKKDVVVRKLLHRKVWKVPFFRLRRKEGGQCGSCRLLKSVIAHMKMITKDWPRQCWRAPRIMFAFHWDSKKSELRDMCKKACFFLPQEGEGRV